MQLYYDVCKRFLPLGIAGTVYKLSLGALTDLGITRHQSQSVFEEAADACYHKPAQRQLMHLTTCTRNCRKLIQTFTERTHVATRSRQGPAPISSCITHDGLYSIGKLGGTSSFST